ncbi:MAG: CRTAC1 family protein [Acidobacteriota bacterium]
MKVWGEGKHRCLEGGPFVRVVTLLAVVSCFGWLAACGGEAPSTAAPEGDTSGAAVAEAEQSSSDAVEPWWVAAEDATGFDFVHFSGRTGELHFAEMMGPGGALVDIDGDGDLDLFLLQGQPLGSGSWQQLQASAQERPAHRSPFSHRLYRNDSPAGAAPQNLRFVDVTTEALPRSSSSPSAASSPNSAPGSYAMGVAAGDIDGDGAVDLYITAYGANRLWRNRGDGSFEDATAKAGVEEGRWSVPASFFDYDGDGDLDLWVGNYLDLTEGNRKPCYSETGALDYCGPAAYNGEGDRLWRNRGDGSFEDVTAEAGLAGARGPALGSAVVDFDGDGWLDLYVANDGEANFLWRNRGDGSFEDLALLAGAAVNSQGLAEASMGVVVEDFNDDGLPDLFLTHLQRETNTLYLNQGGALFRDASSRFGLGAASLAVTAFGAVAVDGNADGALDLAVANGAVKRIPAQVREGSDHPLRQPAQLFVGGAEGGFTEASERVPAFLQPQVGRGLAAGDVDGDGDEDLLVMPNGGPASLLINVAADGARWIGGQPRLRGGGEALGAMVGLELESPSGETSVIWRRSARDGSYASSGDPRVRFFPVSEAESYTLRVRWPGGVEERFPGLATGRYHQLVEGQGSR